MKNPADITISSPRIRAIVCVFAVAVDDGGGVCGR
jgi:hypothetical protein